VGPKNVAKWLRNRLFRLLAAVAAQWNDEYSEEAFWLSPVRRKSGLTFVE
jgi:hypothetical protein